MTDTTATASSAVPASKGLPARALGVLLAPGSTFAAVAARPRSLGILVLTIAIVAGGTFALMSTEVGQQASLDQQTRVIESFGLHLNDAQYAQMEAGAKNARYYSLAGQIVFLPIIVAIIAGVMWLVLTALLGGSGTYKQVFAVAAHSTVVLAVQSLFALPLDYVRQSLSSPTTLAVFLPFLDENSFAGRLFGSIDLFVLWWAAVLAIGLAVLYRRRTTPILAGLVSVYVFCALAISAVRTVLSGA